MVNIINSKGIHVGVVTGTAILDLEGQKLYELKGINIYRLSGELVGHLNDLNSALHGATLIARWTTGAPNLRRSSLKRSPPGRRRGNERGCQRR